MASNKTSVLVKRAKDLEDGLVIPAKLARTLAVPDSGRITLGVGALRKPVSLRIDPLAETILIGNSLAESVSLPQSAKLFVKYEPEQHQLRLGPFIAILACRRTKAKGPKSRALFGARTLDIRQLLRHAAKLGASAFVLTPRDVDPSKESVLGYVISGRRWAVKRFPVPDVVYDRIQSRGWEREAASEQAKAYLQSFPHLSFFNSGFFDKWELYEKVVSNPHISRYLPETAQLTDAEDLRSFLRRHQSIFVKPAGGSLGRGVVRIRRINGGYEWRRGGRIQRTSRFDVLYNNISRIKGRARYIMQPDLRLATFGGSPFDVRLLMQKDSTGEWKRTKTYARVAARGSLTSNLSRGGTGMGLGYVLRSRFGRSGPLISRRIRAAAGSIVQGLDEVLGPNLGEVGLDLGVSGKGRIWLIEVNSKPYRKVFTAGPKIGTFRSFRRPMAFARYLAKF